MKERKKLSWPPEIGKRICRDTGWAHNSWSGEVRAIVDEEYAVVKRWVSRWKSWRYVIVERWEAEALTFFEGSVRKGTKGRRAE